MAISKSAGNPWVNEKKCYGCRTCEMACSFHHHGFFAPALSSIKISRSNLTGQVGWALDSTCDACAGEEVPFCIKYCAYGAVERWVSS